MIKAVIFDMDGLMINSEPLQSKAFEKVLKCYKKVPIPNANGVIQKVGIREADNWLILKKKYNLTASIVALQKRRKPIYENLLRKDLQPMPGLLALLPQLEGKYKLALASSSSLRQIKIVLSSLKIESFFNILTSGETVSHGKPSPEIFLLTALKLDVKPDQCLVLEDSESGVEAAKRAGMHIIAIPNSFTQNHDFTQADKVLSSLEEVSDLV